MKRISIDIQKNKIIRITVAHNSHIKIVDVSKIGEILLSDFIELVLLEEKKNENSLF